MTVAFALLALCAQINAAPPPPQVMASLPSDVYKAKNFYHLIGMKGFSDALLTMHFKLYEGYVKNTNALIEKIREKELNHEMDTLEYSGLKRMFGFEFDGMRLHELYFENLGGKRPLNSAAPLYKQVIKDFGSYENWEQSFIATGMLRGVGWSILYFDPKVNRLYNVWVNEHNINELAEGVIILAMDVWEHAYITEYGLSRIDYIQAFLTNINWNVVSNRYDMARHL